MLNFIMKFHLFLNRFLIVLIIFNLVALPISTTGYAAGEGEEKDCQYAVDADAMKKCYSDHYHHETKMLHNAAAGVKITTAVLAFVNFILGHTVFKNAKDPCPSVAMKLIVAESIVGLIGEVTGFIYLKVKSHELKKKYAHEKEKQNIYVFLKEETQLIKKVEITKIVTLAIVATISWAAFVAALLELFKPALICGVTDEHKPDHTPKPTTTDSKEADASLDEITKAKPVSPPPPDSALKRPPGSLPTAPPPIPPGPPKPKLPIVPPSVMNESPHLQNAMKDLSRMIANLIPLSPSYAAGDGSGPWKPTTPEAIEMTAWGMEMVLIIPELLHIFGKHHGICTECGEAVKGTKAGIGRVVFSALSAILNTTLAALVGLTYEETLANEKYLIEEEEKFLAIPHDHGISTDSHTSTDLQTFQESNTQKIINQMLSSFEVKMEESFSPSMNDVTNAFLADAQARPESKNTFATCISGKGEFDVKCQCRKNESCFQIPSFFTDKVFSYHEEKIQKVAQITNDIFRGKISIMDVDDKEMWGIMNSTYKIINTNQKKLDGLLAKKGVVNLLGSKGLLIKLDKMAKSIPPEALADYAQIGKKSKVGFKNIDFKALSKMNDYQKQEILAQAVVASNSAAEDKPTDNEAINPFASTPNDPSEDNSKKDYKYQGGLYKESDKSLWKILSQRYFKKFQELLE